MWDLIVSVPDHCSSFYFVISQNCLHVLLTLKRPLILCCILHYYLNWQNLTSKAPFMTL